ncbi:transcriptional regulatory protein [Roseobacter sp. SK209-2-6]|nr:transcriptional regulatory protein [Roseobacter sp. SK209-2-6]
MAGLTTAQFAVLFVLDKDDGMPISEIAKRLSMGKSGLTGLVDRMVALDLVTREASTEDRRVNRVRLLPKGIELLQKGKQETRHFNEALLAPFNEAERATIQQFLDHVTRNAEAIIAAPEGEE